MLLRRLTLGILPLILFVPDARASLGDDAASVVADGAALGAPHEIAVSARWELHTLRLPSGTLVHEWVAQGKVFAIAWGGPALPDLRRLLGAYFEPWVKDPRGRATGHHHERVVATRDWVVQSAGHRGGFVGRAWLTAQLPSGFDLATVRAW